MTQMYQLISHLWNSDGRKHIWWREGSYWKWKAFDSVEPALELAKELSEDGMNVYHACAVFKPDPKPDKKKGADRRLQKFVIACNALWTDFDVAQEDDSDDEKRKKYESKADVLKDVKRFCDKHGIPTPTVVDSGGGIHIYWLLKETLGPDVWFRAAESLKNAMFADGLKVDPARSSDSASILRPPGTFNYKFDSPRRVKVLGFKEPCSVKDIESKFQEFKPVTREKKKKTKTLRFDIEYPPSDPEIVADKCMQIAYIKDTGGNVDEPLWYAGLGVLVHTTDIKVCHEWSKGHPAYDKGETDKKIAQWLDKNLGPTTCTKFESINPEGCKGCPFKSTVKSPIQLGSKVTPMDDSTDQDEFVWPKSVGMFDIGAEGVWLNIDSPEMVLGSPMHIEKIGRLGYDDAVATVHWWTPTGTEHVAEMSLTVLGEPRLMRNWLLSKGIANYGQIEAVMDFMREYVVKLAKVAEYDSICEKYGWQNSEQCFMLGQSAIEPKGISPVRVSHNIPSRLRNAFIDKGSLDKWADGSLLFDKAGYEAQSFIVTAMFSSVLFKIMGVSGAVLSVAGKTGTAKTTSVEYGMSIWGDPTSLINSPQDTKTSRGELLRIFNSMPVVFDDVGNHGTEMSELIYMAANGRAKQRTAQTGHLKENDTWQTILVLTTNSPVLDLPTKLLGEAERRRVLEIPVEHAMERRDAQTLKTVMRKNYGVAGKQFIQEVLKHDVTSLVKKWQDIVTNIIDVQKVPDENRFGVWLIAASIIAGRLAKEAGIIKYDYKKGCMYALNSLKLNAKETDSDEDSILESIREWVNMNLGRIQWRQHNNWLGLPKLEVVARVDYDTNRLYIPVRRINHILSENKISGIAFREWKKQHNIEAGYMALAMKGAVQRCLFLPANIFITDITKEIKNVET